MTCVISAIGSSIPHNDLPSWTGFRPLPTFHVKCLRAEAFMGFTIL
jgi:hypothetical protein